MFLGGGMVARRKVCVLTLLLCVSAKGSEEQGYRMFY